jgi:hypothetical protein
VHYWCFFYDWCPAGWVFGWKTHSQGQVLMAIMYMEYG